MIRLLHWQSLSCNILYFHSVFTSKFHLHRLSECEVLILSSNRMLVAFFKSDMYSLNPAKQICRHFFYSIHMKWRLTCVVFVVFVFLIIVFVIGGWKSPICERPCVQINLSNIWWIPWGWTNLGALDFHYENGYRATKMHLNTSQPRQGSLGTWQNIFHYLGHFLWVFV